VRDPFADLYADVLDGTYDCVDRIVLNAYSRLLMSPGGFRTWWRDLQGDDHDLDNARLMRYAGRFSRRVSAYAKKHGIPLIYCPTGERKHEIAEPHVANAANRAGVVCILVGRAPARVWNVKRYGNGGINIEAKQPQVNQYFFHIMDPDWGHIIIKLCPHPPFFAQVILNGHEFVARQATKSGISFRKEGNCFTDVSDASGLARIAETLSAQRSIGRLVQVCERWIYSSCLCFALELAEQRRTRFRYAYSVYQAEYSRNFLFTRGRHMEQVFHGVIDRTRAPLSIRTVKTIFGHRHRPWKRSSKDKSPRFEVVVERPTYDLTVFKVHFKRLTVKIYTKGERVLRIEAIAHNTKDLRCRRSIERLAEIVAALREMVERFLSVLRCVDAPFLDLGVLENWPLPSMLGTTRVAGLDINKPRMRAVLEAIVALATQPMGFSLSELAAKVAEILRQPYTPRQAAYDLRKLRAKDVAQRIHATRRHTASVQGLRSAAALLVLREKVLKPLLAAARNPEPRARRNAISALDLHYDRLQTAMHGLLQELRIAC
jgi:hypothetical protein